MPKGGARARSGPPPSPDALRRERDSREWTKLPGSGFQGPRPDWPEDAVADPTTAEVRMWERLWKTPQAMVWHADGVQDTVALYVRAFLEASKPEASGAARTFVRQLQDALLLSIPALHAARYVIDRDLTAEQHEPGSTAPARPLPVASGEGSVRDRFTVVPPLDDEA